MLQEPLVPLHYVMFFVLQWWLDRCSEELLGEEAARRLRDEEERRKEAWRLQQQEDERLALALSQEFIHHQLVSRDVGGEEMVVLTLYIL